MCEDIEKGVGPGGGLHTAIGNLEGDWSRHSDVLLKLQFREFPKSALKLSEELLSLVNGINWADRFQGPEILLAKRCRDC